MFALEKPVWREKTRSSSPEVRAAVTSVAGRDWGNPPFPSLIRNKIKGVSACRVPKSVICGRSVCPRMSVRVKTLHNEVCCSVLVVWHWNGFLDNANERNTRWRRRGHEWRRVREQLSAIKTAPRVKPYREFVERGHLTSVGHRYKEVSNQDGDGQISLF